MPYDKNCSLWPRVDRQYFLERSFHLVHQEGPSSVSAILAVLTGTSPARFLGKVNTQDPTSWADALHPWGLTLAYCPTDLRKVRFYADELLALDDLFTVSYYMPNNTTDLLANPDPSGYVTDAHLVLLHRDKLFDPSLEAPCDLRGHRCMDCHTKRIFRVVPLDYPRTI